VHLADSAKFEGVTSNKLCNGLTGSCFESPNDTIHVTVIGKRLKILLTYKTMDQHKFYFQIPKSLNEISELLEECFYEAVQKSQVGKADQIKFVKYESKNLSINDIGGASIIMASSVIIWFSKKWIDTYLWPIVKDKIDEPSKDIQKFIEQQLLYNQ